MKPVYAINDDLRDLRDLRDLDVLAVFGSPHESELPQVAGEEDILLDVYSDILNLPREYAAGYFHGQYAVDFENGKRLVN